jgi:hypothetical protein
MTRVIKELGLFITGELTFPYEIKNESCSTRTKISSFVRLDIILAGDLPLPYEIKNESYST